MSVGSVKVFQRSDSFKFLVSLFTVFMTFMLVCFLFFIKENLFITIAFTVSMGVAVLGGLVMISGKIIVTSVAIVSENTLKKRVIPFKAIKRIYIKQIRHAYVLFVSTEQTQIGLHGGATKKQLDEMVNYILEQIRLNDPEHYQLVNLPSYEVEDFWRK